MKLKKVFEFANDYFVSVDSLLWRPFSGLSFLLKKVTERCMQFSELWEVSMFAAGIGWVR